MKIYHYTLITNKVSHQDHTHCILTPKLQGISNMNIHEALQLQVFRTTSQLTSTCMYMEALQLQVFKYKQLQTN